MNSPNKSATEIVTDFLFLPFFQTPLIPNSRLWELGWFVGGKNLCKKYSCDSWNLWF